MICPGCGAPLTAQPDSSGLLICPTCGARLRARASNATKSARSPSAGPASAPAESTPTAPPPAPAAAVAPATPPAVTLEALLSEIRALGRTQGEMLGLLRALGGTAPPDTLDGDLAFGMPDEAPTAAPPPMRSRRRKTVLLIDDDQGTRESAVAALSQAEVPTRAVADGSGAISSIAAEKPDVIVLELGLTGSMAGQDVVNVIKATMEWVDIPIVLYTREPVASQKEARQVHGADEVVLKGPGGPEALVQRVISIFRRG